MKTIKFTIAYDGSNFHGWQMQPGVPTIQAALVDVARKITEEKIFVYGASRTDAGVHALGQVAHFKTRSGLSAAEFQRAFNALLPPQIRIMEAEEVGPDFHSRWQALGKTYQYRIFRARVVPPFEYGRVLHYPWPLDEAAMCDAARLFEGELDFTSFAASSGSDDDDRDRNMLRVIHQSEIQRTANAASNYPSDELVYTIRGRSFLRYMVRKIVGTLLDVGRGKLTVSNVSEIFAARDRARSGPTAPSEGLYLMSIEYPDPTASLNYKSENYKSEQIRTASRPNQ